jgi:hypothetical protein
MQSAFQLPQFSVVVWLRKTEKFEVLKSELLTAADLAPYESTEPQGTELSAGSFSQHESCHGLPQISQPARRSRETDK